MEKAVYYYDEIIRWIEEKKITLWDLALKLDLTLSNSYNIENLLKSICNDDSLVKTLKIQLKENSENYVREHIDENIKFNFTTLSYLANYGFSSTEVMKWFGFYNYKQYTNALRKAIVQENVKEDIVKEIKSKIISNRKHKDVEILPNDIYFFTITSTKEISASSIEVIDNESKIIIYSSEYLKDVDFREEFINSKDEKIILASTLKKVVLDKPIDNTKKDFLEKAIDNPNINLKILMPMTNYDFNTPSKSVLSCENDLLISQALMLANETNKKIYIAVKNNVTALNALNLDLGIRCPKKYVFKQLKDIFDDDTLNYFDYKIENNDLSNIANKKAYVLDSSFIIAKFPFSEKIRDYSFISTDESKVILHPVLKELILPNDFFSIIYVAKHNPTIKVHLDVPLCYRYEDISILNLAMYFKRKYSLDFTLLTCDKKLYLETLQYNLKSIYYTIRNKTSSYK